MPYYATYGDYMYGRNGVSAQDWALFQRIMAQFAKTKFSLGTVHVYIFTADLVPLGTLHVTYAAKTEVLKPFLNDVVVKRNVIGGNPPFPPRPQSRPPATPKGSLVAHVVIRAVSLDSFPKENYAVLTPGDQARLLPASPLEPGASWKLDEAVASKFAVYFHPTLEWVVNGPDYKYQTKIENLDLTATELSREEDMTVAKLEGKLKMLRTAFAFDPNNSTVTANLIGYMRFKGRQVLSLELVVKDAFFGNYEFEGYVESMPGGPARGFTPRLVSRAAR